MYDFSYDFFMFIGKEVQNSYRIIHMNRIVFYIVNFITQHNSALNKDHSHNYHMERKKLDEHTSECSYEMIMIFYIKLL